MIGTKKIDSLAAAAYKAIRKEWENMVHIKREITKEQAENVIHHNNWEGIFDISEVCGYGVYGERVREEDGKYYVEYSRGDSCD